MILNVRHFAGNILQANVEPAIFQIDVFAPVRCASRTASSSSTSRTSGAINSSASTDRIIERVSSDSDSDESDNEQVSPMRRVVYRRHKASASLDAIPLYNDASTSRDSDIKVSAVKEYEDGKIDATAVRTSQKNTHSVVQASAAEDCKIYVDTSSVSQEGTTDIMKASASSEECKIRIATASASSEDSKIEIGKSSARRRVPCSTSDDSSDSDSASSSCSRTYIGRYRRPGTQSQLITQRQQETQRQLAQPCLPPMFQSAFDIGVNLGLMSDATETAAVANSGQEESSSGSNLSSVSTIETMIENRMTFVCPTYTAERVLFLQFA